MAEDSGDADDNFISWVEECVENYSNVNTIKAASSISDATYDLSGRPVDSLVKGVYIRNGKKVVIK